MIDDFDYIARRARQETALAQRATSPAIARLHGQMADHFRRLGEAATAEPQDATA